MRTEAAHSESGRRMRRRWCAFSLLLLLSLATIAAFNAAIDPYGVFNGPRIDGLNRDKQPGDVRLSKAYALAHGRYDGLVLGSSRSEIGLDVRHPAWADYRAYNAALPGSNIHELLRYLQHAQAVQPLRRVLLGLDFVYFSGRARWSPVFVDARLRVDGDGHLQPRHWPDYLDAGLSASALKRSWRTLRDNRRGTGPSHTDQGQVAHDQPFRYVQRFGGFVPAFQALENDYLGPGGWGRAEPGNRYFYGSHGPHATLDVYEALLRFCHLHDIELVLVISPLHIHLQLGLLATGMHDTFQLWKRELVERNTAMAEDYEREPFLLFDFATVNAYTIEAVPPPGADRQPTAMQWFWDPAHYRSELGDRLQAVALLGEADADPRFGLPLQPETLAAALAADAEALASYRNRHPALWQKLQARYGHLRDGRPRTRPR